MGNYRVTDPDKLTPRQREAVRLTMLLGSQKAACEAMGVSYQTLKNLTTQAYQRLGVPSNLEAAKALGWLDVPDA